ncbi:facilitated trehalose transporter Tret1-like [Sitodiplosis mosellana]|uniref:facilitated trehalose transporter Tret1-like n=1 Tax=Sitodiplosis mosellana TaxID=263140 RepID=UPI002444813C|nr:facilitated trehalose transporter Tret1-like [Sitodiplosis mosellana]
MSTTEKSNEKRCERDGREKVDKIRRFLAQFCATTVENLLLIDMGLCRTFPFIIIAALTGFPNKHNVDETLSLTPIEASWLASFGFISEPIGSLLSALITAEKLKELKRKQTLKPFSIVMALFCISVFSTTFSMSTYIVQILKAYKIPMEPDEAAAVLSYVNILGTISFLCLIRFTGRRYLYLTMLSVVFLSAAVICGYGFMVLPIGYSSFPDLSPNFPLENSDLGYIPFVCIILSSFCNFCGIDSMGWQMISEVFPYKTRGIATGITAALYYVLRFIGAKTFYSLETTLSMPGVALFNCIIIAFGLILMYKILPETENRTLEDIEMHFSDNSKKLTDRKIPKLDLSQIGSAKNNSNMPTRPVSIKGIDEQNNKKSGIGCDNRSFVADS